MKVRDVLKDEVLPSGVWRKTHLTPKPVGVELFIRNVDGLTLDKHSGSTRFLSGGKMLQNVVYSYDKTEEWLDTQNINQ